MEEKIWKKICHWKSIFLAVCWHVQLIAKTRTKKGTYWLFFAMKSSFNFDSEIIFSWEKTKRNEQYGVKVESVENYAFSLILLVFFFLFVIHVHKEGVWIGCSWHVADTSWVIQWKKLTLKTKNFCLWKCPWKSNKLCKNRLQQFSSFSPIKTSQGKSFEIETSPLIIDFWFKVDIFQAECRSHKKEPTPPSHNEERVHLWLGS